MNKDKPDSLYPLYIGCADSRSRIFFGSTGKFVSVRFCNRSYLYFSILGQAMARTVAQTEMTEIARGLTVCSNKMFSEVMSCCRLAIMWQ
jgi:hypothetical protein